MKEEEEIMIKENEYLKKQIKALKAQKALDDMINKDLNEYNEEIKEELNKSNIKNYEELKKKYDKLDESYDEQLKEIKDERETHEEYRDNAWAMLYDEIIEHYHEEQYQYDVDDAIRNATYQICEDIEDIDNHYLCYKKLKITDNEGSYPREEIIQKLFKHYEIKDYEAA